MRRRGYPKAMDNWRNAPIAVTKLHELVSQPEAAAELRWRRGATITQKVLRAVRDIVQWV